MSQREEAEARIHAAEAAQERLDELVEEGCASIGYGRACPWLYSFRSNRFRRPRRRRRTTASRGALVPLPAFPG